MGRYYSGDIEGKFWFAVQSSNDVSFFGGEVSDPNYLSYYFGKEDIKDLEEGIKKCKEELGDNLVKLEKFFSKAEMYSDEDVEKVLEISDKDKVRSMLQWFARLGLGEKILNCVKENSECSFEAEC